MHFPNKELAQLFCILVVATGGAMFFIVNKNGPFKATWSSGDMPAYRQPLAHNVSLLVKEQKARPNDIQQFIKIAAKKPEMSFRIDQKFNFSSCPYSLQGKLQKSNWSSQYYQPAIQMVMTSANINQKEYERLKKYHMPYGFFYKERLQFKDLSNRLKLFSKEESILGFESNERPRCVSCAVVGNGGILNGSGMGKEIDKHDMVFRVNHCIRRGYEHDVGNRTTHYVFMDRSLMHTQQSDIPNDKGIKWVFLPCRLHDYKYITEVAKGSNPKQKLKVKAADIRLLHPDFVRYINKIWLRTKSFRPSTGAVMFLTALHTGCDSLCLYGMGYNTKYTGYYYDNTFSVYKNITASHDFRREVKIIKELDRAGVINWYKRDVPDFLS